MDPRARTFGRWWSAFRHHCATVGLTVDAAPDPLWRWAFDAGLSPAAALSVLREVMV